MKTRLALAIAAVLAAGPALAAYPERPMSLIVPWAAGGGTDAVARAFAAGLEKELGQPVNVVNRTGGAGVIGHSEIVNARPDGYTIGLATAEITTLHWTGTANFTHEKVTPIALINFDSAAFNVSAASPWADARAALDAIKAAPPGTYKMSGSAPGSAYHLALAGLFQKQGINPLHVPVVPSQGAAPGFQELAAGGVHVVFSSLPEAKPMLDANRIKSLAVLSAERSPAFPSVPTAKEAVGLEWVGGTWRGIVGPAGLPKDVTDRLIAATEKVFNSADFQTFMRDRGFGVTWAAGDAFGRFMAEQDARNGEVMQALGLRQRS